MNQPDLYSNISALSSVLDRIDSTAKPKKIAKVSTDENRTESTSTAVASSLPSSSAVSLVTAPVVPVWCEYVDPASRKSYFYNLVTKETTWDKPEHFIPAPTSSNNSSNSNNTGTSDLGSYRSVGLFNAQDGRFTATKAHLFDETGRPIDRSLRQLSNYIDVTELEKNREEAKSKRAEVARALAGTNWKEYNKEKKEAKKRKRMQAMLED